MPLSWAHVITARQTERERGDRIAREVRALLNKLTPTNFEKMSERLVALEFCGLRDMRGVVEEVVGRAQNLLFTGVFADLCCAVSDRMPSFDPSPPALKRKVTFRELLLAGDQQSVFMTRVPVHFVDNY